MIHSNIAMPASFLKMTLYDQFPEFTQQYDINGLWDTTRYTDLQKKLIGRTAQYRIKRNNIGGSQQTQYLVGATDHYESTVFPAILPIRSSVHFGVNSASANGKFHIQLTAVTWLTNNRLPQTDLTGIAIAQAPNAPRL